MQSLLLANNWIEMNRMWPYDLSDFFSVTTQSRANSRFMDTETRCHHVKNLPKKKIDLPALVLYGKKSCWNKTFFLISIIFLFGQMLTQTALSKLLASFWGIKWSTFVSFNGPNATFATLTWCFWGALNNWRSLGMLCRLT